MRRLALVVAAVVVVGVVAWLALRERADHHGSDTSAPMATQGSGAAGGSGAASPSSGFTGGAQPALPPTSETGSAAAPPESPEAARAAELARTQAELAKTSPVPINSRPLLETETMFLAPNARRDRLMPSTPAERGAKPELYYLFTGDRYAIIGGETLTTTLQAWTDEAKTQVAPITIRSANVGKTALKYTPGANGAFTNTWAPSSSGLAAGNHTIDIAFVGPSGAELHAQLSLAYTPKAAVPARFTGKLTDRLDKGSLVVAAAMDVVDAGEFIIDANLFDSAGKPIARANFRGELAKGSQNVDLVFYGKIIRDHGVPGPFVVRNLRGYRTRPGEQPNRVDMVAHPDDYKTKDYALDVFTSDPWPQPGRPIVPSGS